jgi:tartrate-resistant acid phosphatase type 5
MNQGLLPVAVTLALTSLPLCASAQEDGPPDPAAAREIPAFEVPAERDGVIYQRFLAIGDWGTGGRGQRRVAQAMAARAEATPIDFVITTGDNFYPRGVSSADDPQWRQKFEDVYAAASLQVPFFPSLGNHDHMGDPDAQVAYSERNPLWRMPGRYYSHTVELDDGQQALFVVLDTDDLNMRIRSPSFEAQMEWLEETLAGSSARWRIVYGHHPLYSYSIRGHNRWLVHLLEPLFVRYGVDVYLAGHDHNLQLLRPVEGVHYVVTGAASGSDRPYPVAWPEESLYASSGGGYVLARLSRDELLLEFVRAAGETEFAHTLTKPARVLR